MLRNDKFILYGSIFAFVIPLFIMILMFVLMVRKLRMQLSKINNNKNSNFSSSFSLACRQRSFEYNSGLLKHQSARLEEYTSGQTNSSGCECVIQIETSFNSKKKKKIKILKKPNRELNQSPLRRHASRSVSQNPNFKSSFGSIASHRASIKSSKSIKSFKSINSLNKSSRIDSFSLGQSKTRDSSTFKNCLLYKTRTHDLKNGFLSHLAHNEVQNEVKALQVLGIVFIAFIIAWLPYCLVNILSALFSIYEIELIQFQQFLIYLTYLGYFQSTFNPIIYTMFNKKFRKNFIEILNCSNTKAHKNYK